MADGRYLGTPIAVHFAVLRRELKSALETARRKKRGYWLTDKTLKGVTVTNATSLEKIDLIWPKLWCHLEEFLRAGKPMSQFKASYAKNNERLGVLDVVEERGLHDVVKAVGNKASFTERPRTEGCAARRDSDADAVSRAQWVSSSTLSVAGKCSPRPHARVARDMGYEPRGIMSYSAGGDRSRCTGPRNRFGTCLGLRTDE